MPESRDRISRSTDLAAIFEQRRRNLVIGVVQDEPETETETGPSDGSSVQQRPATATTQRPMYGRFPRRRNRASRGRSPYNLPYARENSVAGRSLRGRGRSALPPWYPRTPLRDVTTVMRAIERRRVGVRELAGQQTESPITQRIGLLEPPLLYGVQLEHDKSNVTSGQAAGSELRPTSAGRVSKILDDVINQSAGSSEFLTPQKKLLNSIDKVEKVVMEELQSLKRTPAAKRAEREKRLRTLMSMR